MRRNLRRKRQGDSGRRQAENGHVSGGGAGKSTRRISNHPPYSEGPSRATLAPALHCTGQRRRLYATALNPRGAQHTRAGVTPRIGSPHRLGEAQPQAVYPSAGQGPVEGWDQRLADAVLLLKRRTHASRLFGGSILPVLIAHRGARRRWIGSGSRTRTVDLPLTTRLLYQMS